MVMQAVRISFVQGIGTGAATFTYSFGVCMRISLSVRIYAIIGLSFCGLLGLALFQALNLSTSLRQQRQSELQHLVQNALSIVRDEYDKANGGSTSMVDAQKRAAERLAKLRYGSGDYFWINDLAPRMVMHPLKPELNGQDLSQNKDPNGKRLFVEFADVVKKQGAGFVDYQWPKPGKDAPQPKLSYVAGFEPWGWVVGTGVYIDDMQAQVWHSASEVIWAALGVIVIVGGITLLIARRTSKALASMTAALDRLASGDFDIQLPGLARKDELGDMARSIAQFKIKSMERANEIAREESERLQAMDRMKAKALRDMAETVERETNKAVGEVAGGTEEMAGNASSMTESALTLGKNSSSVAAAAEQALANTQTVARASAQLATSISEIAAQVKSSRELTARAVSASAEAQTTVAKLSEAASKVGAVTSLINEIAGQTNLLALNATIEAARAGEAGRGFAVVASEVKSLAEQTARATSEIAQQISEIQSSTQASVASIGAIGEVIRNVEAVSSTIANAIQAQDGVTLEISRTVEETSHAAREVATQIASVSREASETGRRASQIRDGSLDIAKKVDLLRETLVRVIRTSTGDVDRRRSSRAEIGRPGVITTDGKIINVIVRDLSLGGAMVEHADAAFPATDRQLELAIEGIGSHLKGAIARTNGRSAVILWKHTEDQKATVEHLMARLAA
ncbi:methyl-accepting chemotaxis protein [Bradyrhizobium sp. USDA 4353]